MLERADEDPRFHSFFQVPPEVRNLIYTIHLDSLPQDGALSRTPFLSHASPQLRREVLPLWYGTQTLEIPMHIQARYSLDHERHRKIEYMHDIKASSTDPARPYTILHTLIRRTEAFLTHAPDYIFAMLKHILISVQIEVTCCQDEPGCTVNDTFLLELEIDFDGETQPWTTWSSGTSFLGGGVEDRREEVNDAGGQMMDDMERNLRILMREIRKRDDDGGEGRMRLRRRDLEWMREVVRLGVW
ncbi:hypothetical protein CLAFUW4_06091 [Fulvia fulva]|uniref:Uncharacterized protein n=1 Tax=Passalora fulva TaxID=5499 RepID=A0A9Q8LGV9_PASFU|nr:uncharacterized protein CLAFUR5_06235 [Fulvia fulva]KAK4623644.1 hypothetical protein CLAFUR4_06095 [Fulvia fulva]KAK4625658.1 hypothetical protein CLAFUR0_06099 [Fulvia fulva]UJO17406.1 hypothetical protein CLAFUR5_06235 [Fulvia fulva]WPV14520.1 hypothetical protein CLAFUW4_06091 [Fulvia fulva]WPV29954.1 hypothetical protein CLAFUW7_06088 [Fulvia fulva]